MVSRTGKGFCRVMGTRAMLSIVLVWSAFVATVGAAEHDDLTEELKVAYIYNFTRFIDWPEIPPGQPFVIGVIGDSRIEQPLRILEAEKRQAQGRPIEIRSFASVDAIGVCELLFVGRAVDEHLDAIVQRMAGSPTLLVGDTPGYAGRGVAIEFFLKPDVFRKKERLRFRIDPGALEGRGLKVSAQLMDVAEVVE